MITDHKTRRLLGGALLVAVLTSGCSGMTRSSGDGSISVEEISAAFRESGRNLIARLRRLMGYAPETQAIDYQTAIALESVRISPRQVADRADFYREISRLEDALHEQPTTSVPRDSAVLVYLAEVARGRQDADVPGLSRTERDKVARLCGPTGLATLGDADSDDLLRRSCFLWLLGDAPKANSLLYYVEHQAPAAGPPGTFDGDETPFDVFMARLRNETGIDLLAHRYRLVRAVGGQPERLRVSRGPAAQAGTAKPPA
jgi:hypothetical protein